jgi:hypothetical protein
MNYSKTSKIYLFISGLILTAIGGLTTFIPAMIKAKVGIEIAGNPSALNDVRSIGVLLLATALLSFLGSFKISLRKPAIISSFLLFLSLGLGRILSMALDGMPSSEMVKGTGLEITLGVAGLIIFILSNNKKN